MNFDGTVEGARAHGVELRSTVRDPIIMIIIMTANPTYRSHGRGPEGAPILSHPSAVGACAIVYLVLGRYDNR